ncbi:MAG: TonB-dependent receptor [Bacteroidales bacterium]|nr:TonB-dependent receptor [Bacteroidales bacterium]
MNKKTILACALAIFISATSSAQTSDNTSEQQSKAAKQTTAQASEARATAKQTTAQTSEETFEQLNEVVVGAVRVQKNAPFAVSNIGKKELTDFSSSGKELPFLFARTPGVVAWSENGTGIGTSYMRIRGAGGANIHVSLDGVPLNSPEDQCVFWANMNSYSQLLSNVQIQRGIGSTSSGDGLFGGGISLSSSAPSLIPTATLSGAYGSFNSYNAGAKISTGLLWNHLILEGAYHESGTDGFLNGTHGRAGSYMGALHYLGRGFKLSYRLVGNFENTGQAWNGVTAGNDDLSLMDGSYCDANWAYDQHTGIFTYKDLCERGLGRYNSLYEKLVTDSNGIFVEENGQFKTERHTMSDGTFWPRTTDNFWQNHHILNGAWRINEYLNASATLHYTHGYGWYDEFRSQNKLLKYGIPVFTDKGGNTVKKSDFVRQKGLTQHHFGGLAHLIYQKNALKLTAGLGVQQFLGNHYAYLTYCSHPELSETLLKDGRYQYYNSDADKLDLNVFAKAAYELTREWSLFGELQYRHVHYQTFGGNDKYIDNGDGTATQQTLNINESYHFVNPKIGANFSLDGHRAYSSLAMSSREPERNNFTDNGNYPAPRPERLIDYELGYQYATKKWNVGANLYYMYYIDQLVQTGEKSDIGESLTTNVGKSYRSGIELTGAWEALSWLKFEGNAALSANRILDFDEVVEDWDNGSQTFHYTNKTLAYSPSAILNLFLDFHYKGFSAIWHTSYVSRQYLDNSENMERSLPGYSLSSLNLGYTLKLPKIVKEIHFGIDISNIFNARVAQSGWVYSAIAESLGHSNDNRYYQIGFIPVAPISALGHIRIHF